MANFDFGLPKSVSFSVFYFASRPGHTVEPITTNESSKRGYLNKVVLFESKNSPKNNFLGPGFWPDVALTRAVNN